MEIQNIRIHGDNILECERTLHLLALSLNSKAEYQDSPIHNPIYLIVDKEGKNKLLLQLFPGYNRWGVNIYGELQKLGAPLREATDSILTRVINNKEEIIFSIEYCNALPAGNNAWQRTGRALTSASLDIPYIHVSDIGGIELDSDRNQKAARFPNPIIPFSYITLGKNYNSLTLPIYLPSPTISPNTKKIFGDVFGSKELLDLIANLIRGKNNQEIVDTIVNKNLEVVNLLSSNRKRKDTLRGNEWSEFLDFKSSIDRLYWIEKKDLDWKKKNSGKVTITPSFAKLLEISKKFNTISVGAGDIPICLIPPKSRKYFVKELKNIYGDSLDGNFLEWFSKEDMPLVIIWITGFKPRGDDSRPDRGLVPLARMLLGPEAEMISIVYGPANKKMWKILKEDPKKLAIQNGLWESVINLSDALLVDSTTCDYSPFGTLINRNKKISKGRIELPLSKKVTKFSEQDVDSVIHFIFTNHKEPNIFESMCNPPGGDWSGLSIKNLSDNIEYRWTSLPRVSKTEGKRPDHVIQYATKDGNFLFSIESKETPNSFGENIGPRLNRYTQDLLSNPPTAIRTKDTSWGLHKGVNKLKDKMTYVSIGAFRFRKLEELDSVMKEGKFDLVLGLEFKSNDKVLIHLKTINKENPFIEILKKLVDSFKLRLEVKVY